MRKAMVTILIGEKFQRIWSERARPSWEAYAGRHGYDIVIIDRVIDPSPRANERSLIWQKLLALSVPEVQRFDRVLWLDSDVIINAETAPCAMEATPPDKIGAVRDQALLSHPSLALAFARTNGWTGSPSELARFLYRENGLSPEFGYFMN